MTSIIIFDTDVNAEEISNKSELELFYDELKKTTKMRFQQIEMFYEMERKSNNSDLTDSSIDSVILDQIMPYVVPILNEIPGIDVQSQNITKFNLKEVTNKPIKAKEEQQKSVSVKLKNRTIYIYKNQLLTASAKSNINVIGVAFLPDLSRIMRKYNLFDAALIDTVITGSYGIYDYWQNTYNTFHTDIHPSINGSRNLQLRTYNFTSLIFKNTKEELVALKRVINVLNDFYQQSHMQLYKRANAIYNSNFHEQVEPAYKIRTSATNLKANPKANPLGAILKQDLSYDNVFDTLLNINNIGYYDIYNKLLLHGETTKKLERDLKYKIDVLNAQEEQNFQKFKRQMELFQKKHISFQKFQKSDLYNLSDKEMALVNKEYEKQLMRKTLSEEDLDRIYTLQYAINADNNEKIQAGLNNILPLLEKTTIDPTKELYAQNVTTFLQDKNKHNYICPHVVDKANALLKAGTDIFGRSFKVSSMLITHYGIAYTNGYFCKICGEFLSDKTGDEDVTTVSKKDYSSKSINDFDNLYSIIHREVIYIISTYISFISASSLNLMSIVKNITELIKDEIRMVESNLLKVKTAQRENILITLNIYIYIYTFAAICQLIYTNSDTMRFKHTFTKGGKVTVKSPFIHYGGKAESKTKPVTKTLTKIPKATTATTKTKPVTKTTKTPSKATTAEAKTEAKPVEEIDPSEAKLKTKSKNIKKNKVDLQKIINDALYMLKHIKYADIQKSDFISLDGIKPIFLKAYRWVINLRYVSINYSTVNYFIQNSVTEYLIYGYNQIAFQKGTKPLPNLYTYDLPSLLVKPDNPLFTRIKEILGRDYATVSKELIEKGIGAYSSIVSPKGWNNKYAAGSFDMFIEYVTKELFAENVKDNKNLSDFYEKYKYLMQFDKNRVKNKRKRNLRPYMSIKNIEYPTDKVKEVCLCDKFDLVYQKLTNKGQPTGPTKIFKKDEIQNWLQEKDYKKIEEFKSWKLVELKCIGCKDRGGKGEINVFYKYYEYTCPVGELHEYVNDQCKKCSVTRDIFNSLDRDYYNKYKDVYRKTRQVERDLLNAQLNKSKSVKKTTMPAVSFPAWEPDVTSINKVIKLLKMPENEVYNIGLYEKNDYDNVKNGIINLRDINDDDSVKRNNGIYNHYLYIIRSYYLLKNSEVLSVLPFYMKEFLDKYSNKDLYTKLPNINQDFIDKYKYYKRKILPSEMSNFLLTSIAKTLLNIHEIFEGNKQSDMGYDFIKMLLTNILHSEKKLTNFRVTKIKKIYNIENDSDPIADNEDSKEGEYDDIDVIENEIAGELEYDVDTVQDIEPDDPFSINDMDVEVDDEDNNDNLYHDVADRS